jgi:hypothetical protein
MAHEITIEFARQQIRRKCCGLLLSGADWAVLEHYLDQVDAEHFRKAEELHAWPSIDLQMRMLRLCQGTVIRCRRKLREIGLLQRLNPEAPIGKDHVALYRLDWRFRPNPKFIRKAQWHGEPIAVPLDRDKERESA